MNTIPQKESQWIWPDRKEIDEPLKSNENLKREITLYFKYSAVALALTVVSIIIYCLTY